MSWRNPPARDRAVQILFKYRAQVFRRHRSQHPSRLRSRNGFRRAGTRYHSLGAGGRRRTLELLRHAGLPRDPAAELSGYLVSSLVGMVIVEPGHHHGSDIEKPDDAIRVRMPSLIALPPRKYANVVDTRRSLGACASPDAYYKLGMDMLIRPGPCRRSTPLPQTVKIQPRDEKPAPDLLACRYRGRSWGRARRPADRSIIKLRKPAPRSSTQPKIVLPTRTWACLEEPVKTEDTSIDRQPHVKKCPLPRNGE
jgi:hypothetical protein